MLKQVILSWKVAFVCGIVTEYWFTHHTEMQIQVHLMPFHLEPRSQEVYIFYCVFIRV